MVVLFNTGSGAPAAARYRGGENEVLRSNFLAPAYKIIAGLGPHSAQAGLPLKEEVTRFITSVEYESADGIADMVKLNIDNPDAIWSDAGLFQPGNEMEIYGGYYGAQGKRVTTELPFIGRAEITRCNTVFHEHGPCTLEVTAYSKDHVMMSHAPKGKPTAKKIKDPTTGRFLAATPTRVFKNGIRAMLQEKCEFYQFHLDMDEDIDIGSITQKTKMSDYALVKGCANITGYWFWVDYDQTFARWTLHFRKASPVQHETYTFVRNRGDDTTILNFEPEMAMHDARTDLYVEARNPHAGKAITAKITDFAGGEVADLAAPKNGDPSAPIANAPASGAAVKLFFGEYSIDTVAQGRFQGPNAQKQLEQWARVWFQRQRDQFITGKAKLIGLESIMARQVHKFFGVGKLYDGEYYFARVRHVWDTNGYRLETNVRKKLAPLVL